MLAEATILTLYGVTFARLVYKIMNDKPTTNTPWEPQPISAKDFHQGDMHVNINRAPLDQVTGVTFKRALNIKRIAYTPSSSRFASDTADHPESWQAQGTAIVRWLFSEHTTTAEGLVTGATFAFLHDVHLPSATQTEQRAHPGETHLLYIVAGTGWLYHRPTAGSPIITRPLRTGDAALIRGTELYSIANTSAGELVLLIVGLNELGMLNTTDQPRL